ncbi:MAG: phosphotransferase [Phycisphaera sp.]|nr:phosphotransferase [Phycisphaera sp.]
MTKGRAPKSPTPQSSALPDAPHTAHDHYDAQSLFGAGLEIALQHATGDHLHDLHWFRTDWQRSGALTGYATFRADGVDRPAVVKLPVPPQELAWLERLQRDRHDFGQVVPDIYACGRECGQYDLPWVVMQRMPHGPLDHTWDGTEFDLLVEAAGRFYAAAALIDEDRPPKAHNWADVIKLSRKAVRENELHESQRWNAALKTAQKHLPKWLKKWTKRPVDDWCHGDLHLANAMTMTPAPEGPAVLFDLATMRRGHWVEDAVYFEHLFWSTPSRLAGRDVVRMINTERKKHGLHTGADWPLLADIRRALLAAAAPAQHTDRPDPVHLHAALMNLEKLIKKLP